MKIMAPAAAAFLFWTGALFAQSATRLDTQLLTAASRGECRANAGLLKKGANPNARDDEGATALMLAAIPCPANVITQLLDSRAEIEARDSNGQTALMYAIERDPPEGGEYRKTQMDVIRVLIARKASTAAKDTDGATLLHYAARQRNPAVVRFLLDAGLPVDARDKDGTTPLFTAAAYNEEAQIIEMLLAAGADPNARLNTGMSVLAVAQERGNESAVRLLQARGARAEGRAALPRPSVSSAADLAPIDGVTFEQWARANGRLTAEVPLETVIASLGLNKARWERVQEQWTERLAQNTLTIGTEYARHFRAAMEEEAAKSGAPGTTGGSPEPIPFEKWVEVQEASSAASERLPALYGMSRADWSRVNFWWGQRLKAKQVDKAAYDQLAQKYEKQFATKPPAASAPVLREGALEANREPVSLETWVEMQQADAAAQAWTLKRHGLTMGQWIRATMYWGERFNKALVGMSSGTPDERAEAQRMRSEQMRLSEIYRKKYAQGVPW